MPGARQLPPAWGTWSLECPSLRLRVLPLHTIPSQTSTIKGISSLGGFSNQSPCFTWTCFSVRSHRAAFCTSHHSLLLWPCLVFVSLSSPSLPFAGGSAPPTNPLTPRSLHCYLCTHRPSSYRARGKKIRGVPFFDKTKETFSLVCEQMDF